MIGLAALGALGLATCQGGLCGGHALDPWFAKLAAQGSVRAGKPLHILQIGDSHTAGDAITGAWRDLLQARYGSGGRGAMPPGRPYDGFLSHGATAAMSPGWRIAGTFGPSWSGVHPPIGLAGFSLTSDAPGARIGLVADAGERFDRFVVCAIAKPGAGSIAIRVGGTTDRMDLGSPTERPECKAVQTDTLAEDAAVTVEQGPVTITSIGSFHDGQGGIALSNVGVVGAQLVHFARTDDAVLDEEFRAYDPDLIVIAFGTNEGFVGRFVPFEYEITLRTQIGRIRRLAGKVPILLLGAPDAASRRPEMRANAAGYDAQDCRGTNAPPAAALPGAPRADAIGSIVAGIGGVAPPPSAQPVAKPAVAGGLFPPAALKAVRDVQRRVAASLGVAFWDWEARMGGRCTAVGWARQTPPLMRGDYVHYTSAGGREIAGRLQADLDKAAAAR